MKPGGQVGPTYTPSLTVKPSAYNEPEKTAGDWFLMAMLSLACFVGGLVIGLLI